MDTVHHINFEMARQNEKKCAYVFYELNGKVSWDLVTYFNKIQYDMHIDVGGYFVFNLKDVL